MVSITIVFFARCRDLVGCEREELRFSEPPSVEAVIEAIARRYPPLRELLARSLIAVNERYATPQVRLSDGDTVAVIPPVSGGMDRELIRLTRDPIVVREIVAQLVSDRDGAVVTFEGVVRDRSLGKQVLHLEYEAYESMALAMLRQIGQEARRKWPLTAVGIVHRIGRVEVGETSVAIVVISAHRRPAFEACSYIIERVKRIVPIWKREYFEDGAVWVEPDGTLTCSTALRESGEG